MKTKHPPLPLLPRKQVLARLDSVKVAPSMKRHDTTTITTSGTTCGFVTPE